jgi:hypothetical protein
VRSDFSLQEAIKASDHRKLETKLLAELVTRMALRNTFRNSPGQIFHGLLRRTPFGEIFAKTPISPAGTKTRRKKISQSAFAQK